MYLPVFLDLLVICKKVRKDLKEKILNLGLEYQKKFTRFGERAWKDIQCDQRKCVFGELQVIWFSWSVEDEAE